MVHLACKNIHLIAKTIQIQKKHYRLYLKELNKKNRPIQASVTQKK